MNVAAILDQAVDLVASDRDDGHLIPAKELTLDRLREAQVMDDGTEELLVIHRSELDAEARRLRFVASPEHGRCGGEEQPTLRRDRVVRKQRPKVGSHRAGAPVRLIGDHKVERASACLPNRLGKSC